MRRLILAVGLALVLVLPMALPAVAAFLHEPHKGTSCGDGYVGRWHFVANQTDGASRGYIVASFTLEDGRTVRITKRADRVNRNVQHFNVPAGEGATTLNDAASFLAGGAHMPGKLVLSDVTCEEVKKD